MQPIWITRIAVLLMVPPLLMGAGAADDMALICKTAKTEKSRQRFAQKVSAGLKTKGGKNTWSAIAALPDNEKLAALKNAAKEMGVKNWDCPEIARHFGAQKLVWAGTRSKSCPRCPPANSTATAKIAADGTIVVRSPTSTKAGQPGPATEYKVTHKHYHRVLSHFGGLKPNKDTIGAVLPTGFKRHGKTSRWYLIGPKGKRYAMFELFKPGYYLRLVKAYRSKQMLNKVIVKLNGMEAVKEASTPAKKVPSLVWRSSPHFWKHFLKHANTSFKLVPVR